MLEERIKMKIIISHQTAQKYYRWYRSFRHHVFKQDFRYLNSISVPLKVEKDEAKFAHSYFCNMLEIKLPELLISEINNRKNSNYVKIRYSNLHYPKNSFLKIDDDIFIPCPELLLYQLVQILDHVDLLLFGFEICGNYSVSYQDDKTFSSDIPPITTSRRIKLYLDKLHALNRHCYGINKAIYLANILNNNSASPQESRLYLMLCAHRSLGGYGIKNMVLNRSVVMKNTSEKISLQYTIIPDISNPKKKIAIEYDSAMFHNNVKQDNKDKLRFNAMQTAG